MFNFTKENATFHHKTLISPVKSRFLHNANVKAYPHSVPFPYPKTPMIPIKAPMIIGSACSSRHRAREDLMYAAAISAAFKAL